MSCYFVFCRVYEGFSSANYNWWSNFNFNWHCFNYHHSQHHNISVNSICILVWHTLFPRSAEICNARHGHKRCLGQECRACQQDLSCMFVHAETTKLKQVEKGVSWAELCQTNELVSACLRMCLTHCYMVQNLDNGKCCLCWTLHDEFDPWCLDLLTPYLPVQVASVAQVIFFKWPREGKGANIVLMHNLCSMIKINSITNTVLLTCFVKIKYKQDIYLLWASCLHEKHTKSSISVNSQWCSTCVI